MAAPSFDNVLVVGISSRALFNFEQEDAIFQKEGAKAYQEFQLQRLDEVAAPGTAFPLINKLLAFNRHGEHRVEVVVLSRNDPVSGLRVFKSAEAHQLPITRGAFTRGRPPYGYLSPLKADLFLSPNEDDVREALCAGIPAARVFSESARAAESHPNEVRIAFDGDAVLFSDEAERVFQTEGLHRFQQHEAANAQQPLNPGPFKPFLEALHLLQKNPPRGVDMCIRTALVTARSAPAHDRAIRTLMSWNVEIDEALFLGGMDKGPFLKAFEPDFFFDDQIGHCNSAALAGPTGHVDYGVANAKRSESQASSGQRADSPDEAAAAASQLPLIG